jgi:acyl-ACP thioesterase
VIARIKIELVEPLRLLDEICVETWPSGLLRSAALRDFRVHKASREIGRATSLWFVLDMESRYPVRPHELLPESLHPQTEHLVTLSRSIPKLSETPEIEHQFAVRFADIDLNQHVTATSYVAWALEAVPEAIWAKMRLTSLDVQFMEECLLGQEIVTASKALDTTSRIHRISRVADNKELARVVTTWTSREDVRHNASNPEIDLVSASE